MTGKQRILSAFRGETPDLVPFSPNLYYWFYNRKASGTLPPCLAGATHPIDALRALGADILARWDTMHSTREVYREGEFWEEFGGASPFPETVVTAFNTYPPRKSLRRRKFVTPHGVLTHTWQLSGVARADFETEFWWKDWSEYEAVRYMLEARDYEWDRADFYRWAERVGNDGVVMVHITQSPLKTFHWLAGAENATLFLADHPAEMQELACIHERKALALLESTVDDPAAQVFVSLDNLDSDFYSPRLYRDYCHEFFSRAAEVVHARGKFLVVHACGRNRALMPLVGKSRVDSLEGITPPPMGNVPLAEACRMAAFDGFTVNGGMDTAHLEMTWGAERAIHEYTRELFKGMGGKTHFIFASSCSTPPATPWENLEYFRDAARK